MPPNTCLLALLYTMGSVLLLLLHGVFGSPRYLETVFAFLLSPGVSLYSMHFLIALAAVDQC